MMFNYSFIPNVTFHIPFVEFTSPFGGWAGKVIATWKLTNRLQIRAVVFLFSTKFVHLWRRPKILEAFLSMATGEKQVMVVGIDDSAHSLYALEWTLDHLLVPISPVNSPFKLIVVHAKPSASSAISLAGPGNWFHFLLDSWFDWS